MEEKISTFDKAKHAAERKAFDLAITTALKYVGDKRAEGMIKMVDLVQKILKDTWPDQAYDKLREVFRDPNSKYFQYTNNLFDTVDQTSAMSPASAVTREPGNYPRSMIAIFPGRS